MRKKINLSIETIPDMTQVIKLVSKDIKTAIINSYYNCNPYV